MFKICLQAAFSVGLRHPFPQQSQHAQCGQTEIKTTHQQPMLIGIFRQIVLLLPCSVAAHVSPQAHMFVWVMRTRRHVCKIGNMHCPCWPLFRQALPILGQGFYIQTQNTQHHQSAYPPHDHQTALPNALTIQKRPVNVYRPLDIRC